MSGFRAGQPVMLWGAESMVVAQATARGDVHTITLAADYVADPEGAAASAVAFTGDQADVDVVPCAWFALCDQTAVALEPHPVLGAVPICERCRAKNERLAQ
ncbi:hypothetical protein SEA_EVANESCE_45 [Mycobacterium phage Evanesce]|uniref:Uncharacterized protein n=15 Tax=Caudoviricetes TaxID=2731619 RepID=A0A385D0W6_9CAUD|nr:hypothetical protein Giles_44 [Mycobacterium phage Giles]AHY84230.1 hypothetical protein PBI_HH92_45 [Mycobacterium phage HH92]AKQ07822.1 hypothetical protein SEA_KINBOTE_46 [Mycobacterium phage Kinbote]ALA06690.1 hypothetical protein SEA_OBUpride_46 [Mycobacterium phage OBUpride]ALF00266.1 hypothetical protein SEA_EVANESCE_45 [Mycobacterium phage Evanesce]ATN90420.1 hypothetical protein SEA_LILHAZELNUT_46 [Mycobacterium phage LilHazelnut]AXQ51477.1 hypothetical protein SEA_AMOCHICK_46 [My